MGGRKLSLWMAAGVFVLFLVGNYGLRNLVILPSFSELERAEAQKDVARVVDAIGREAHHIGQTSSAWAAWDDTYRFVQDGNSEFVESNLQWKVLEADTGLNLIYILDLQGRVVWGEIYDSGRGGKLLSEDFPADALGADHHLLQFESFEADHNGLITTDLGPMLISSHPILTSSGEGPSAGTFLMGRFLDDGIVESLRMQTKVDFALKAASGQVLSEEERIALKRLDLEPSVIEEAGAESLRGYGLISDLRGEAGLLVSAVIPRVIMKKGREAAGLASFSVLLVAMAVVAIGTVIAMMITNIVRGEASSSSPGVGLLSVFLVATAGLSVTFLAFSFVNDWEEEKIEARFEEQSQKCIESFARELEHDIDEIEALRRLYGSSGEVGRREFRAFVTPSLEKHEAIQALEWLPRVKAAERAVHEDAARRDGLENYVITEKAADGALVAAGEREVYYPVAHIEPLAGNEAALGYAPGPEHPELWAAIQKARDSGRITATAGVRLVQEAEDLLGILVLAPVYERGKGIGTLEERRLNLKGLAMGVFRVGESFEKVSEGIASTGIEVRIFDRSGAGEDLLYSHDSTPEVGENRDSPRRLEYGEELEVGGRKWSVVCTAAPEFFEANRQWESLSVLFGGLLLTGLLTSYVLGSGRRTAGIEAMVRKRTEDLQKSEAKLRNIFESVEDVYCETALSDGTIVELSPSVENLLGYRREELIGASFAALYPSSGHRAAFLASLKELGHVSDYEVALVGRGKEVVCSFNAKIVRDGAGEKKIVGTIRDMSARKRSEDALRRTMKEAESARKRAEGSEESLRSSREQLLETLAEMERFNRLMMEREGRVLELKEEVNGLLLDAGRPAAYETTGGAS